MMYAVPGMPPMSSWTPLQRELWRQAHEDHDPRVRSDAWAALEKELAGPRQEAVKTVRVLTWGAGPGGGADWQPLTQAPVPGLRIAPPGMAGR